MAKKTDPEDTEFTRASDCAELRERNYRQTLAAEKRHELLLAPYGVSFQMVRTLIYLLRRPEGETPSRVADDLMLLRQTMTNTVDALEKRALVERIPNPGDRRSIMVRLTREGTRLAQAVLMEEHRYTTRLYDHFTQEELDCYYRLRERMNEAKDTELTKILEERDGPAK